MESVFEEISSADTISLIETSQQYGLQRKELV